MGSSILPPLDHYTSRKALIDGILFLWRTSYWCAIETISMAHQTRCATKICDLCGAPKAHAPQK
jgi:hypothetical protein